MKRFASPSPTPPRAEVPVSNLPKITTEQLKEIVVEYISWDQGSDYPWEGMALTDAEFMEALVALAAKAPAHEKRKFCKWLAEGDEI